jgi:RNA polymerase sigma factor (sigma-70 family)
MGISVLLGNLAGNHTRNRAAFQRVGGRAPRAACGLPDPGPARSPPTPFLKAAFDLPAALVYSGPGRDAYAPGRASGRQPIRAVNKKLSSGGYLIDRPVNIAVESSVRSLDSPLEAARQIETPMDHREFDYDTFIKPLESRMMRSVWRIVRQKEAAEDALQDALARIWRKRGAVARHPNPEAFVLRISVNAAYDAVRKMRRRLRHEIPGLPDWIADSSVPPVSQEAGEQVLRASILEAISRLPKRQAMAVLLRIVEGQSYEDIARGMGCSVTTARIHVMRGRAVLCRRLAHLRPDFSRRYKDADNGGAI